MSNTELLVNGSDEAAVTPAAANAAAHAAAWIQRIETHPDWPLLSRLTMRLSASVPVTQFRVSSLLALEAGQIIESGWPITQDIGLSVGTVRLCWTEFEVVEQRMAVRLTRLA